jgi:hypothetical protein
MALASSSLTITWASSVSSARSQQASACLVNDLALLAASGEALSEQPVKAAVSVGRGTSGGADVIASNYVRLLVPMQSHLHVRLHRASSFSRCRTRS